MEYLHNPYLEENMATKKSEPAKAIEKVETKTPELVEVKKVITAKEIEDLIMMGKEGLMADQIYGIIAPASKDPTDILPEPKDDFQGVFDPLQRFINMYQPSEFVTRQNFRKHLLQILEDWHEQFSPKKETKDE